jgi:hypothetical protein
MVCVEQCGTEIVLYGLMWDGMVVCMVCMVQYGMGLYGLMSDSMVLYGMCGTMWDGIEIYGMMWDGMESYGMVLCGMVCMVLYGTVWYGMDGVVCMV